MLSSGWQITFVFDAAAPVTAWPKSIRVLIDCSSDERGERYLTWVAKDHNGADFRHRACWEHLCGIVDELTALR
jgi:hypothetical protein